MSNNEGQFPPINPLIGMLIDNDKTRQHSNNTTQSTINKPPQGAKIIGSYLLGRNIGMGNYGKVYMAMHIPTNQKVAIKVIDKSKMAAIDVKRVKSEIEILKAIKHRHIITLYQIIETEKSLLLVTQYIPNGELFQYIIKQKKIAEEEACTYFQQIISAVQYLHRNKIAHRDLKPENILLDSDRQLKIIDFGLGSFYQKNELKSFCGSPCYASPQIVAAKKHYDPLYADLWSCGIILYSMLCGYLPFCDADSKTLYKKILGCSYKIPSHVSPQARNLIQNILVLTPSKRFAIKQIRNHKWFNLVAPSQAYGVDIGQFIAIDKPLLARVKLMGVKQQDIKQGIFKNQKNKDTATYYILMKKLVRSGELIPSYIGNDNFNRKLIQKFEKKNMEEDTDSMGTPPENVIIIDSPDAPEIPEPHEEKVVGCDQWWYQQNHTSEEIRQIDEEELKLFAQNILDVIIYQYAIKPEVHQIKQILQPEQSKKVIGSQYLARKRQQKFYAENKFYRQKIRNFERVNKIDLRSDGNLDANSKKIMQEEGQLIDYVQKKPQRLKKLVSLQVKERFIQSRGSNLKRSSSRVDNMSSFLPKIQKKVDPKILLKIKELEKTYGLVKSIIPKRLPNNL